jgi:hypothetical protein
MTEAGDDGIVWFPAKRYGWGWGPPVRWQGWAVLISYVALLGLSALLFLPQHPLRFLLMASILTAVLILVCALKGEKPRWRWGNE